MAKKLTDRQRFERWAWNEVYPLDKFDNRARTYRSPATADAWRGYQAALRSERRRGKR